ncbi:hypothetical protein AAHH80_31940, partial [Burkholderia pseudomallei]
IHDVSVVLLIKDRPFCRSLLTTSFYKVNDDLRRCSEPTRRSKRGAGFFRFRAVAPDFLRATGVSACPAGSARRDAVIDLNGPARSPAG